MLSAALDVSSLSQKGFQYLVKYRHGSVPAGKTRSFFLAIHRCTFSHEIESQEMPRFCLRWKLAIYSMRKTIPSRLNPYWRIFGGSAPILQKVTRGTAVRPDFIWTWGCFFAPWSSPSSDSANSTNLGKILTRPPDGGNCWIANNASRHRAQIDRLIPRAGCIA